MVGILDKKMKRRAILAGAARGVAALMVNLANACAKAPRKPFFQGPLPEADDYDNPNWTFERAKRLGAGLSVSEMAWCLGVSPSTIRRYERGAKVPRPAKIFYLMMGSGLICQRGWYGVSVTNVACILLGKGHGVDLPEQMQKMLDPPYYGIPDKWRCDH